MVELSDSRPTELRALAAFQTNLKLVVRLIYTGVHALVCVRPECACG